MRYYEFTITGSRYSLCVKKKAFERFLDSISVPDDSKPPHFVTPGKNATTHFIETNTGLHVVICVGQLNDSTDIEIIGLLAHECVHVWQEIKKWMGEEMPGDEVEAYSIQSIFVNMLHEYRRKTNNGTKTSTANHPLPTL